jgi:hypothetical protein
MFQRLEVFDPAMCCSTGVCGPTRDPALARMAADLEWAKAHGVRVERHGLSQDPQAFVANTTVRAALEGAGVASLPMVLVDGRVLSQGRYPDREALAAALGLAAGQGAAASGARGASCCAPAPNGHTPQVSKGGCG